MKLHDSKAVMLVAISTLFAGLSVAQAEVSKETLESISIPDKVKTSIGTLEFFDGVPTDATISKIYDNLDRSRAVQVYLDNVGGVSINSVLDGLAKAGADATHKVAVFEQLMNSQTLVVTANTSTLYAYSGTNLEKDGPTVPGKSWFTILRMYGPLEPWINKTWRPGEIELVK
ncbi:hypothetical protein P4E94_05715 [Pontiellaceae bacterium B12219]|nr:hypothetical protein [Pontiellaceae bacterium B12219]